MTAIAGRRRRRAGRAAPHRASLEDVFVSVLARGRGAGPANRDRKSNLGDAGRALRKWHGYPEADASGSPNSVARGGGRGPGEAVRQFHGRQSHQFPGGPRGDLRFSRPQRGGQIDHHPHALRHPRAQRRRRHGGRLRPGHAIRADQGQHRLHEPEVLALPGPDRRGEHRLLQRHLPHSGRREARHASSG